MVRLTSADALPPLPSVAVQENVVATLERVFEDTRCEFRVCVGRQREDHDELVRMREELAAVRKESADTAAKSRDLEKAQADLRQENALTRLQLADHLKRVEVWDARRWALVAVLVSSLLAMASGLVVALARK